MNDHLLLQEYVRDKSEAAFETLSNRYVALVYSAALRRTGDTHLAEDVTQAVFVVLAQKAKHLPANTTLPAWLLSVTRLVANNARRQRGNQRKTSEAVMNSLGQPNTGDAARWEEIAPLLDDAIADLPDVDRNAVVLRFFQKHTFEDVGNQLGISSDAAKKRVERALEKLRRFFFSKGISASALALGVLITNEAVHAAPAGLVAGLPAAVIAAQSGIHFSQSTLLAKGAIHTMTMITVKKAVVAAGLLLVGLLGGGAIASAMIFKFHPPATELATPKSPALEQKLTEPPPPIQPPTLPPPTPARAQEEPPPPAKVAPPVNLMTGIDPAADASNGTWILDNGELKMISRTAYVRFDFPYKPPEEYDYKIEFTVTEVRQDVVMFCSHNGALFTWKMGMDGNRTCVFEEIGETKGGKNITKRTLKAVHEVGRRSSAMVQVRKTGVKGFMNGQEISRYDTDYKDMHLTNAWRRTPTPECLAVGCYMTPFILHSAEVVEISGRGTVLRAPGMKGIPRFDPPSDEAAWAKAIDLLPVIDPVRDAVSGKWMRSERGLMCEAEAFARLELPYRPPQEYDFKMVFSYASGAGEVHQFAAMGAKTFQWCLNGWGKKEFKGLSSFQSFDRYPADTYNPTTAYVPDVTVAGRTHTSVVQVRKGSSTAYLDGQMVSRMNLGYSDVHPIKAWMLPTPGFLGVGANNCTMTIQKLELLEVTGKGAVELPPAPKSTLPLLDPTPPPKGGAGKPEKDVF